MGHFFFKLKKALHDLRFTITRLPCLQHAHPPEGQLTDGSSICTIHQRRLFLGPTHGPEALASCSQIQRTLRVQRQACL